MFGNDIQISDNHTKQKQEQLEEISPIKTITTPTLVKPDGEQNLIKIKVAEFQPPDESPNTQEQRQT